MLNTKEQRKKILEAAYISGIKNSQGELFEKLKLKKQTVEYALKKMEQEKLFCKTKYDVDLNRLGVGQFAWILVRVNWENYEQEKFIKKILELTPVVTVAEITGTYDLAIKIFGPSINYLSSVVLAIEKLFQGVILGVIIYFANKEYKRHYQPMKQNKELYKVNKIDCAILREKTQNPKISLIEIADKHNFHRNSVSKRWNLLWERGVLVKEMPDLTQRGYDEIKMGLKAFILIKPIPGREEKIIKELMKQRNIQDIFTTLSNEIIIVIRTENSQTLAQEHRRVARVDASIKRTNTSIFLTKHNKNTISLKDIHALVSNRK